MALPARQSRYAPSRWDPFAALEDLHDEMSRLLTNVFPDVGRISVNAWSPPIDVEESDDAYVVEATRHRIPIVSTPSAEVGPSEQGEGPSEQGEGPSEQGEHQGEQPGEQGEQPGEQGEQS